jgi:hypothetical protein
MQVKEINTRTIYADKNSQIILLGICISFNYIPPLSLDKIFLCPKHESDVFLLNN